MTDDEAVDADELEPVAEFRDGARAHLCQMSLQAGGVEAWLSQPSLAGVAPDLGIALGIEILVRSSDAAAARELVAAFESGDVALPAEPSMCARCNSPEVERVPRPARTGAALGSILVGSFRPDVAWVWKCSRCGNEWQ